MLYIDKNTHKQAGDEVIDDFLNTCCRTPDGRYQGIRYDKTRDAGTNPAFCSANGRSFRKRLVNILLDNQQRRCCYCLRKLKINKVDGDDELVTLEHIIPRGFESGAAKLAYYQRCSTIDSTKVLLTDEFESSAVQTLPPYPHKVAYNNIVASCNGTFPNELSSRGGKSRICCNEARIEKDAYPVYFLPNIADMVVYSSNGDINAKSGSGYETEITTLISSVKLQCQSLLDIRQLWFELHRCNYREIYSCKTESEREYLFSRVLYVSSTIGPERASELHTKFKVQENWDTFMLYNEFYRIYCQLYPCSAD